MTQLKLVKSHTHTTDIRVFERLRFWTKHNNSHLRVHSTKKTVVIPAQNINRSSSGDDLFFNDVIGPVPFVTEYIVLCFDNKFEKMKFLLTFDSSWSLLETGKANDVQTYEVCSYDYRT